MRTIFTGRHGSQLYGLDTPESDQDFKSIFIPNMRDLLAGKVKEIINQSTGDNGSKNTAADVDNELISLRKFINLACAGETYVLDMLHTTPEHTIVTSNVWEYIHRNRDKFYCTNMKAYLGYVMKQASKYGVKGSRVAALRQVVDVMSLLPDADFEKRMTEIASLLPKNEFCFWQNDEKANQTFYVLLGRKYLQTIKVKEFSKAVEKLWAEYGERARRAEANQGIDWKALSHAMRGGLQLREIYTTGDLKYPLKDHDLLMGIKQGRLPFSEVQQHLEDVVHDVENLVKQAKANGMRSEPDREFWNNFVTDVYADEMRQYLK